MKKKKNFIQHAIKRPGALRSLVKGPPSEHMAEVREIAKSGTLLQKRQANFFLHVLHPINKKRKSLMKK